jgi:hypothetical protein
MSKTLQQCAKEVRGMVDKAEAVGNFAVSDMLECTENNKDPFRCSRNVRRKDKPSWHSSACDYSWRCTWVVLRCFYTMSVPCEARCFPANCNSSRMTRPTLSPQTANTNSSHGHGLQLPSQRILTSTILFYNRLRLHLRDFSSSHV